MASSVALSEAQARLGELLDRAEGGEEIVIEREGRAGMRLVPVEAEDKPVTQPGKRVFGQNLLGITYIAPDFDAPMSEEELKEWGY
jgi:prevent-host-death family protein